MPKYTPHGVPLPDNFNTIGRAPRRLALTPEVREWLTQPGIARRLAHMQSTDPALYNELAVDLLQHRRAMNGDRQRLGEVLGRDDIPHQPLPFAPPEPYLGGREPHTEAGKTFRTAVENLDADLMTSALIRKMDGDAPPRTSSSSEPPTLRESIEGAASLNYPKE